MRGKGDLQRFDDYLHRITPAYAGKRKFFSGKKSFDGDHPRLCGEKCRKKYTRLYDSGSPPPMRGKATEQTKCRGGVGITPAYAGKSTKWISGQLLL